MGGVSIGMSWLIVTRASVKCSNASITCGHKFERQVPGAQNPNLATGCRHDGAHHDAFHQINLVQPGHLFICE